LQFSAADEDDAEDGEDDDDDVDEAGNVLMIMT